MGRIEDIRKAKERLVSIVELAAQVELKLDSDDQELATAISELDDIVSDAKNAIKSLEKHVDWDKV